MLLLQFPIKVRNKVHSRRQKKLGSVARPETQISFRLARKKLRFTETS